MAEKRRTKPAARRVPTQARSRERYERILDAAAEEFAGVGYDGSTMEAIAERAESAVGSVYQFFPNKLAVYEALVKKHLDGAKALFDALLSATGEAKPPSWEELVDQGVDAFAAFDRSGPLFRAIWTNLPHASGALRDAYAVNREFAARVATLLGRYAPGLSRGRRPLVATMLVEVMTSGLTFAARIDDARFADAVIEETKVLLKRYLAPYTVIPPSRARRSRPRR